MASPEFHVDDALAASFIANKLPGSERKRIVRHLLAGCRQCSERLQQVFQIGDGPLETVEPLGAAGTIRAARALERDIVHGELLWEDIERRKPKERLPYLRSSPRHQTFGVFRAGLAACRKLAQRRPDEAVELAGLLLKLAEMVQPLVKEQQALRYDWRADAALALSNAKRAAGDFQGASSALDLAAAFLGMGTQDELGRAIFQVHKAGLLADLGHFEEAVGILDTAVSLFRFTGDPNSAGKAQLHQALILRHLAPARAFALAEDGLTKIRVETETRAEVSAHYTMAYCAAELGETDEAESILSTYHYLIEQQEESVKASFEWLRARIRFRQDRRAEAEQILRGVQQWYLERGFRFEAVLTSIDLAEMMVEDGRMGEALYLVSEILPALRAWGLHRDSLAVVALLHEKLDAAAVEAGFFRALSEQLRRTWHKNGRAGLPSY